MPQWNDVSKRRNRTLLDMVRSMMSQTDLPISFWGCALETVVFILNLIPSKAVEKTPYEIWKGKKPIMSFLKIWGCETFDRFKEFKNEVENQLGKSIKAIRSDRGGEYLSQEFDEHIKECGIVSQLIPPRTPQWNGVSQRRNRTLLDMVRSMMSQTDLPISFWGYALETARKSGRIRHEPERYGFLITDDQSIVLVDQDKPTTYREAIEDPNSAKWLGAMEAEMQSMYDNQV